MSESAVIALPSATYWWRRIVGMPRVHHTDDEGVASDSRTVAGRITWDINVSTVLILLGALASGMYVLAQTRSQSEQAQHDILDMKVQIQRGLADIKQSIRTLPDQAARVTELERRAGATDQWSGTVEARFIAMRDDISKLQAQVQAIREASQTAALPGGIKHAR